MITKTGAPTPGSDVSKRTSRTDVGSSQLPTRLPRPVSQIGFWSALLSGLLSLAWPITVAIEMAVAPSPPWNGIEALARSYNLIEMLNLVPSLPLASAFLVLMVSIHYFAPEDKKIWSLTGLAFTIVYTVMASTNYLIQLVAVRPSLLSGETDGLAMFVMRNPHSIFMALANSYPYQALAMLFAAWVFSGRKLERWIRWVFVAVGVTVPFQFAYSLGLVPTAIALPVVSIWIIGVPLSSFMLAALFKRR